MSVINQMLKDLDARGGGDPQRRAALASLGQGEGRQAALGRRRRLRSALVLLAAAAVAASVWWLRPAAPVPAPEPEPAPPAAVVAAPPAAVVVAPFAAPIVAASVVDAPLDVPPATVVEAPPAPAPPMRSRIEVLAVEQHDPLAAVREALAGGDAMAALGQIETLRATGGAASAEAEALAAAALQQLGRHEDAIAAYSRALHAESDIGAWWAGLGIALESAGRADAALAAYREAQRRGPLDPALTDYLGGRVEALAAAVPPR